MQFLLGYISGLVTLTFIFTVLAFFRASIEKRIKVIETVMSNAGPRQQGAIIMPEDEYEEVRQAHVKKNSAMGRRTTLSELSDSE